MGALMSRPLAVLCTLAPTMSTRTIFIRLTGLATVGVGLLAGCVTAPAPGPQDPGAGASPAFQAPRRADDSGGAYTLSPAAETLVARADNLIEEGQFEAAAAELERALRIEPGNPRLWQRMAAVRLELNDAEQAEALARKSNRLAADNPAIQSVNWRLIAEARRLLGDQPGYEAAMYRARELQGR